MKQNIILGAYGWRHESWLTTFYPEDLPVEEDEDWRLAYYSNEFDSVLVPASYWYSVQKVGCEAWLDDVNEDFKFLVELNDSIFENNELSELNRQLQILHPQLTALVCLENEIFSDDSVIKLESLINTLEVDVFSLTKNISPALDGSIQSIWQVEKPCASNLAYIKNNLVDLREVRTLVEDFVETSTNTTEQHFQAMNMIVDHPQLQAGDLIKLRSVLQIMGY